MVYDFVFFFFYKLNFPIVNGYEISILISKENKQQLS